MRLHSAPERSIQCAIQCDQIKEVIAILLPTRNLKVRHVLRRAGVVSLKKGHTLLIDLDRVGGQRGVECCCTGGSKRRFQDHMHQLRAFTVGIAVFEGNLELQQDKPAIV